STFCASTEIVSRRPTLGRFGRRPRRMLRDCVQPSRQLLRSAILPNCDVRHSRTRSGTLSSSRAMPFATAVSGALFGSKMNARSLYAPSPLTSPRTIGVNGEPDEMRAYAVSSISGVNGYAADRFSVWRRSLLLVAHPATFGLPAAGVLANEPEPWSRAKPSV